jgi:hypothetical protein
VISGAMLYGSTVANAQQATTAVPLPPQTTQPGQDAIPSQDLQNQGQDQQYGLDQAPQDTQPGNQLDQQQTDPSRTLDQQRTDGAATQPDRSMMRDAQQPAEQGRMDGRPGELGVYMLQSAGPGVAIAQIAGGSAAEAAGLLAGDVILQINNQAVEEPRQITRIIRATPAGEIVALRILRDGQEQDVQATLQTGRFSNRVAFRGSDSQVISGDLSSRTQRLEEQLSMVLRELQQLRQEVMQLRAAHPGTATEQAGFESQLEQGSTQQPGVPPQQDTRPGAGQSPGQPTTTDTDTGLPF